MNRDSLQDALTHISDKHIAEAASAKKRRYAPYITAIAACLALVITLGIVLPKRNNSPSAIHTTNTMAAVLPTVNLSPSETDAPPLIFTPESNGIVPLAAVQYPATVPFPLDQSDYDAWSEQRNAWRQCYQELHSAPDGYADSLTDFWRQSTQTFLGGGKSDNMLYSPVSLYMALAILAQTANGETQQEILTLLGADSMENLAAQAKYVFQNQYQNDGVHTCILANSLWLDDSFAFRQETIDLIADTFYASVYHGALESPDMNIALKNWLSSQTGGLLDDSIANLDPMDIRTALVIASTINYRCKWSSVFSASCNTQGVFHGAKGDQTVTYMHKTLSYGDYYWGDGYSATYLSLDDGSRMWLILPNEDTSAEAVLQNGRAMDMIMGEDASAGQRSLRVNVSVPKFDVSADLDLIKGLQEMGIYKAMDYDLADFTGISANPDNHLWLERAQQGIRVAIDEDGLTGVAYTLMAMPGYGMPLQDEVDFTLDRPFLFVVESGDGLPLFTGIVNQP